MLLITFSRSYCITKNFAVTLISLIVSESELWQSCGCKSVASQCVFIMLVYDENLC